MPLSKMASSTPRLSEYARAFVFPSGIDRTVWPRVEAKGLELGLGFDWWQSQLGSVCLGYDARGKYVATVGGVGLSIPRQVGKTYFVLAVVLILCLLFPGMQVIWTAHHLRTSTRTFTALKGLCRRKKIAPLIVQPNGIRSANGEQQVLFRNRSMIMFGARERGFGRGFDEIDIEVFDEAQILDTKALEDMIAATNQARNPHGALLFFMGTPPRPADPSDAFEARRAKALGGKAGNAVWLEIGADPKSDVDDQAQWPLMNPSFPTRTPLESMERLRENLTDDDSWNREGRGIWDDPSTAGIFPPTVWAANAVDADTTLDIPVVAVDFRTGLEQSYTVVVAGMAEREPIAPRPRIGRTPAVDVARYEQGVGQMWSGDHIVNEVVGICGRLGLSSVTVDVYGDGNAVLIPKLEAAGLTVLKLNTPDMRAAAVGFKDANLNGRLLHLTGPAVAPLNAAVAGAVAKKSMDGFVWDQAKAAVDLTPLRAASAAWWVLHSTDPDYDVLDSFF